MAESLPSSVTLGATPPLAGLSAITYISGFFRTISYSLLSPFLVIIPVGYYLLSPIIISAQLLFDTFVSMPYRAAYVLACLSGIIIGLGARQIVSLAPSTQRSGSPPRTRPPRKSSISRGKRRVTVKTED
ncbi:hypothetical protein EDB87DRAFT_1651066 [Lactarius vividus]|nr:hypothetical protein EDB87DRAFT_1651066 [Lactarius vividus]